MILRERIRLEVRVGTTWTDRGQVRAGVSPMGSDVNRPTPEAVVTRYRFVLHRSADIAVGTAGTRFTWRGLAYTAEGIVETHTIGGRIHHYEAVARAVSY